MNCLVSIMGVYGNPKRTAHISQGGAVTVHSVLSAPELNGACGTVVSYNEGTVKIQMPFSCMDDICELTS